MGKFDGILFMSDFDGTLAHHRVISRENCDAIRYFQSEGGLFAPASGRAPTWFGQWRDFFVPNTWCVTFNGAVLCDVEGNACFSMPICEDFLQVAQRVFDACPAVTYVNFHFYDHNLEIKHEEGPLLGLQFTEPVYKMVFGVPTEESDAVYAAIRGLIDPRYITFRSWINGVEIQNAATGKGNAVDRMRALLGERAGLVVAAGDFENDIDMIRRADIGYAVANAVPDLLKVADRTTVDCREGAIARIIEELERER